MAEKTDQSCKALGHGQVSQEETEMFVEAFFRKILVVVWRSIGYPASVHGSFELRECFYDRAGRAARAGKVARTGRAARTRRTCLTLEGDILSCLVVCGPSLVFGATVFDDSTSDSLTLSFGHYSRREGSSVFCNQPHC